MCVDFPSPHEITPLTLVEQRHRGILASKKDMGMAAREIFDYIGVLTKQYLESYRELSGERQQEWHKLRSAGRWKLARDTRIPQNQSIHCIVGIRQERAEKEGLGGLQ